MVVVVLWSVVSCDELDVVGAARRAVVLCDEDPGVREAVSATALFHEHGPLEVARNAVEHGGRAAGLARAVGRTTRRVAEIDVEVQGDSQHDSRQEHDGEHFDQREAGHQEVPEARRPVRHYSGLP